MTMPRTIGRLLLVSAALSLTTFGGASADVATRKALLETRVATDGAKRAGDAFLRLHKATDAYLALDPAASAEQRSASRQAALVAYREYEAAIPGAKADIAAFVAALKKAGTFQSLDARISANPAAFGTTPAELRALKSAGGPQAVLTDIGRHFDEDLADFRLKLGTNRTAWRFNLSPIPEAKAGLLCSVAAWSVKTVSCWWNDACYNYWASANNSNCQR